MLTKYTSFNPAYTIVWIFERREYQRPLSLFFWNYVIRINDNSVNTYFESDVIHEIRLMNIISFM